MNTKIWKYPTDNPCTDVYVETKIFALIEDITEVEMTNAHVRAAGEAFYRYGEPRGVYPIGLADEVETLPPTGIAVAWLSNIGSAKTPFSLDVTVYEAPADPRANSLAAATKKQQEPSGLTPAGLDLDTGRHLKRALQ